MKTYTLILFLSVCGVVASAQENNSVNLRQMFTSDTAQVEQKVREMLDKDYSTMGMVSASREMESGYDGLLNKYYSLLMSKLDEEGKKALRETQRNWIKMRDSEQKLVANLRRMAQEEAGGGTIWGILQADASAQITRRRVFVLAEYLLFGDLVGN